LMRSSSCLCFLKNAAAQIVRRGIRVPGWGAKGSRGLVDWLIGDW